MVYGINHFVSYFIYISDITYLFFSLEMKELKGGWGEEREAQDGEDICIMTADLYCCTAETNTTL